ncbi:hypothetical protein [Auritidibacter ignavus]|uniref:hypothetical protein n=2 Tax=Auritidibacter ignavus TaxID=678932 RepID=UPI002446EB73|nr:hypothetical protein [Auritidibacter ignavus]WGH85379.1 hypothetical protein QDX24_07230 [Auritidibacter ignavus]
MTMSLRSFTREIHVPLELVRAATYGPSGVAEPKGFRAPGLNTLGKKVSATYRLDGEQYYWNVTGASDVVVFEIDPDFKYSRLILSMDDPVGWERKINNGVGNPTPGALAFRAQQRGSPVLYGHSDQKKQANRRANPNVP